MNIELVEKVVNAAHRGQTDKSGMSYIEHLARVRDSVIKRCLKQVQCFDAGGY